MIKKTVFSSFEREKAEIKNTIVKFQVLEESKTKNKEEETNEKVNEEKLLSSSLNAIVVFLTKQKQNIYFDINYQYQFLVFDS